MHHARPHRITSLLFSFSILLLSSRFAHAQNGDAPVAKSQAVVCNDILDPDVENLNKRAMIDALNLQVIAQEEAVEGLATAVQRVRIGSNDPNKPLSVILFPGPTRVGKTELAKQFVKYLGGKPENLIVIPMNEMTEKGNTTNIKGAAKGNVGYGEETPLHPDAMERQEFQVTRADGSTFMANAVLLDEGDKAHPDIWMLLMRWFDEGLFDLTDGSQSDGRRTFIIITSNFGQEEVLQEIEKYYHELGKPADFDRTGRSYPELQKRIKETTERLLLTKLPREVKTRLTDIIQFYHLNQEHLFKISLKMLGQLQNRYLNQTVFKIGLKVDEDVRRFLISEYTQVENGASDLAKAVEKHIDAKLSNMMAASGAAQSLASGDVIQVSLDGKKLVWKRIGRGYSREELVALAAKEYPGYSMDPPPPPRPAAKRPKKASDDEHEQEPDHKDRATGSPAKPAGAQPGAVLTAPAGAADTGIAQAINESVTQAQLEQFYGKIQQTAVIQKDGGVSYEMRFLELQSGDSSGLIAIRRDTVSGKYSVATVNELPIARKHLRLLLSKIIVSEKKGKIALEFRQ